MIKGIRNFTLYPAIIAMAYWITDGLLYAGVMHSIKAWITIKSIGLLLIPVAVLFAIAKKGKLKPKEIIIVGICSSGWIWLLSSAYMPIMSVVKGKDLGTSFHDFGMMVLWFPVMAIEVSTYSGGLLGLALASIGLPIAAIIIAKKAGSRQVGYNDAKPDDDSNRVAGGV